MPIAGLGLRSFSCTTLWIGFDPTQCACAQDMLNRLIVRGGGRQKKLAVAAPTNCRRRRDEADGSALVYETSLNTKLSKMQMIDLSRFRQRNVNQP